MMAWVLVVLLMSADGVQPGSHVYEKREDCLKDRAAIVHRLSEEPKSDFGFAQPPYGAVSQCVGVPVEMVMRKA